ncbi:MAG: protein translocase subunit SecF [Gammaproteobacteria bacterium]|jgi:preprotein translocase subunit SecF|nr:protein translocase subunit SecF [Gammaproteobacteria bacterium]MBT5680707.1 protein translocase subunit SecF [Gammaproteobacteria bacterium]MBT6025262.1 protein translocase subunit SecF [Gammaproteobacteria bacterium]MBT6557412.1 protein translocase subunit SecF [Gammaproteobacteria bacterium]MDG1123409.1 protein translocase subunit SecF [Pseudomonadales bacterium]
MIGSKFDFMGRRKVATIMSGILLLASVVSLSFSGLNLGLDFTGGSLVEVGLSKEVEPEEVRRYLTGQGFTNGTVQTFGSNTELLIRMPPQPSDAVDEAEIAQSQAQLGDNIFQALLTQYPGMVLRQSNYVGPAVGDELANDGGLALLTALIVVMFYILLRFTKQFSVGAVVALAHDVIIVLGCFSLFQWTFDLTVLAALLAVIGYSLNDTIVVSDRIRENFRKLRRGSPVDIINTSLNQTLGRTLVTSMTTLFVLLALLFAGGEVIRGFASALSIGVLIGTYSSIYVAANVLLVMNISREDLLVPEPEQDGNEDGSYP